MKYLPVLFTVTVWGASLAFTRDILSGLSPSTLIFLRCLLGTITILAMSGPLGWVKAMTRRQWFEAAASGLVGVVIVQLLQAYALKNTSANHAGWLVGLMPMLIAAMTVVFLKEKISGVRTAGFLLGFGGVVAIVLSRQSAVGGIIIPTGFGDFLFIISAVMWAVYAILVSRWFDGVPQTRVTLLNMAISLAVMTVVAGLDTGFSELGSITPHGWLCVLYLGVFTSGVCYYLWNRSVETLGPQRAGSFMYVEPFAGMVSSYFVLGEHTSAAALCGGLLILTGVYWVNGGKFGTGLIKKLVNFEIGF